MESQTFELFGIIFDFLILALILVIIVLIIVFIIYIKREVKLKKIISEIKGINDGEKEKLDAKMELDKQKLEAKSDALNQKLEAKSDAINQKLEAKIEALEAKRDKFAESIIAFEDDARIQHHKIEEANKNISEKEHLLNLKANEIKIMDEELIKRTSALSIEEATRLLIEETRGNLANEFKVLIAEHINTLEIEKKIISQNILLEALENSDVEAINEVVLKQIKIPNDDIKGKLIGRSGRNIRTLENLLGVDIIIDDSPEFISISSFNPIRRHIAQVTLEFLISTGKINQVEIEKEVAKTTTNIEDFILEKGREAVAKYNLLDLNQNLIKLIGSLHYRTSYGQNMLAHSIECAYFAHKLASDLKLDANLAARCALLHDIGKIDSVETGKSHVELGVIYGQQYGESEIVINAIEAHHGDVEPTNPYAIITILADTMSASRKGARKGSFETFVERICALEKEALSFPGVSMAFALQGGREVRVIVENKIIADDMMPKLAFDIKQQIEKNVTFPGIVKVNVLREMRYEAYASKENVLGVINED